MTNRKTLAVLCRAFALVVIVAVAALSWAVFSFTSKKAYADEVETHAEVQLTHDQVFGADHANSRPFSLSDEEIVFVEPGKYSWPDKYFLKPSTFHLTKDEEISNCLQMIASYFGDDTYITVNICLHGHSLTYKSSYAIDMAGDCTLNIYDCGGDDNHSGSIRGLNVINGAEANLYSGAIKGYKDSGVSIYGKTNGKNATFNMYGGEVSGNGTQGTLSGGGGVSIGADGVFNMYSGIISNNTVKKQYGGGVRVGMASSTFHMYGGSITQNTVTFNETESQSTVDFYGGAGVYNNGGTFTVEGNVNISGNVKGKPSSLSANNVEVFYKTNSDGSPVTDYEGNIIYDGKIKITGALGDGSQIGVTAEPGRIVTSGYSDSGNTQNPSVYFNSDNSDNSISFDEDLGKEAAVYEGSAVVGNFTMKSATATSHRGTPRVGDTSISLNIEVTLENEDGQTKTVTDVMTVACSPLKVGSNTVTATYENKGVTKPITYTLTLDKVAATVNWACSGATSTTANAATIALSRSDIIGNIKASYLDYNGQTVTVNGSSADMVVKNSAGTVVNSVTTAGTYTVSLAPSAVYEFSNNLFTLTVTDEPVDEGYYKMKDATVIGVTGTPTAGDTKVGFTIRITLEHTKGQPDKTETASYQANLSTALHGGENAVAFTYTYTDERGGVQTKEISTTVTAAKKQVSVTWSCTDSSTTVSGNTATRDYDGADILDKITARYVGYDGQTKTVVGTSGDIIVKDSDGDVVYSTEGVGTYTISLAQSADYQFSNNTFTLTVNAVNVDDGYYKMKDATAVGVDGTPTVGDKTVRVQVRVTLEHTKDQSIKTENKTTTVTLATPLKVGENKVQFTYKYTDAVGESQTKQLTVTVTAVKKQVTVTWYFNGTIAQNSAAKCEYDGTDFGNKIVAEYTDADGKIQRVNGASTLMLKKDGGGNIVGSLINIGKYTLCLADSADYEFNNNSFTLTVAEKINSELFYEEEDEIILGVSSDDGFESGTEVVVERVEDVDLSGLDGKVSAALNVKFVKDSVEVNPTGIVTVQVLVPDELRSGKSFKIYNLSNGVAKEVKFTVEGGYAVFASDELSTILFVTQENAPIGNNSGTVQIDASAFMWLWVFLAIIAVCSIVSTVVIVVSKRKK